MNNRPLKILQCFRLINCQIIFLMKNLHSKRILRWLPFVKIWCCCTRYNISWTMNIWWGHFLKISQIIIRFRQMGQKSCGVFGVFPVEISAHILSLCVPSPWFSINQPLFLRKTKLSRNLKGKCIWDWDVNLGCKLLGI